MENVFSGEILNITPFKKGFVFATRSATPDGRLKASFFGYDAVNDKFTPIKKSIFLKIKFGYEYEEIAQQLGDYVSCDVGVLSDNRIMAIFPNGEYNIFNTAAYTKKDSAVTGGVFYNCIFVGHCAPDVAAVNGNIANGRTVICKLRSNVERAVCVEDVIFTVGEYSHNSVIVEHAYIAGNIVTELLSDFLIFVAEFYF